VRSTARLFGRRTRPFLAVVFGLMLAALALAGWLGNLSAWFYPSLLPVAFLLLRQAATLDIDDPAGCLRAFRQHREIGLLVAAAILIGRL
jgi:4-hydroxybenzoate polyprenyltransferase